MSRSQLGAAGCADALRHGSSEREGGIEGAHGSKGKAAVPRPTADAFNSFNADDDDDDDDDFFDLAPRGRASPKQPGGRRAALSDFDDARDDEDDDGERFFREPQRGSGAKGLHPPPPQHRATSLSATRAARPLQRAIEDAAALEGTDAPSWLLGD
jgi:hypothetical protein